MKLLKNKIKILLVSLSLIGSIANTKAQDVVYIEKDKPAPYSGVLFPESKVREMRSDLLEKDKLELKLASEQSKTSSLYEVIKLKDTEIELYNKQNARLIKQENTSDTMKYVWFGLGILATGVAVYGAGGLAR